MPSEAQTLESCLSGSPQGEALQTLWSLSKIGPGYGYGTGPFFCGFAVSRGLPLGQSRAAAPPARAGCSRGMDGVSWNGNGISRASVLLLQPESHAVRTARLPGNTAEGMLAASGNAD